jgi:polar amino acid transport system substrate-binding protein
MKRHAGFGVAVALLIAASLSGRPAPAGAAAGLFDQIKKQGQVTVATEAAYYPFEFVDNGKIVGYDKDILDAIIKAWGIKLNQLDLPFAGILPGLMERKYDFVATALLINPDRAKKYAFTMPIAQVKVGVLRRKGDTRVKGADDFSGLVVGTGTPPAGPTVIFMHYNDTLKAQGKGMKEQKMFASSPDEFVALTNKQVDVVIDSTPVLLGAMKKFPDAFELVGTFGDPFWVGWVTRPDNLDLRDAINAQIRRLRDSGELATLQKKWFGYTMEIPDNGYLPAGAIQ